jgi:hypothetical protein
VHVTPNLHDVLKRVRHELEKRTIWIDGLYFNQLDSDEKSRQAILRYRIYRIATRVLVWLGPDPYNSLLLATVNLCEKDCWRA